MVIDGGSTDETVSVLESYRDRFFWVSEPDRGQAHAINKGWKRAKGDILAWLNSDDMYLPGAISNAVRYLTDHPEIGLVYGDGYHVAEDGRMLELLSDRSRSIPNDSLRPASSANRQRSSEGQWLRT